MQQRSTPDVKADILRELASPLHQVAVPDSSSPRARPFLELVWELTQRGWAFSLETGPNEREYLVVDRKGEPLSASRVA